MVARCIQHSFYSRQCPSKSSVTFLVSIFCKKCVTSSYIIHNTCKTIQALYCQLEVSTGGYFVLIENRNQSVVCFSVEIHVRSGRISSRVDNAFSTFAFGG